MMFIYKITDGDVWNGGWDYTYVVHPNEFSDQDFKLILANVIQFAKLEDRTIDVNEIEKILCEDHGFESLERSVTLSQSINKERWNNDDEE